jgi:plasmid maintenance system killer protein
MKYVRTSCFNRSYRKRVKKNKVLEKKVAKALKTFTRDHLYPSLRLEKLGGVENDLFTIRVDKNYRIFFYWRHYKGYKLAILTNIGPHDLYRKL